MTSATLLTWGWGQTAPRLPAATGPKPVRRGPPVFIHDAVTPWQDGTLLLALLRAGADDSAD